MSRGSPEGSGAQVQQQRFKFAAEITKAPNPTEDEVNNTTKEEKKNLDRDGGERQPNRQTDGK